MTSHGACISSTSWVLKVASLQRLKVEALISAPADCEVRFAIKFFNALSKALVEIHLQLCQVYGHMARRSTHLLLEFGGRCLIIIHPVTRTSRPVSSIFSYTSRNSCPVSVVFSEWQTGWDECHTVITIPGGRHLRHRDTKFGPRQMSEFRRYVEK